MLIMKKPLCWRASFAVTLFFFAAAPVRAQVLEPELLLRKQEDQQRARTLTRELLGSVLDVQLRQLDENGLSDQEVYRDIKLMRQNLNHLVETEMTKIVDLLAEAQRLPLEKREAIFIDARQQIRTVVRQLAVERQNLLKRLKIVELVEQVRRLIRQQTVVQENTKGLPAEAQSRQEVLTLKTIEDQRDVKELFLHLVDTLAEMKTWTGTLSSAAADGLRILKVTAVGPHLDQAGRQLQAIQFTQAFDEQTLAIKGLNELLKVIERTQGSPNSEIGATLDRIRDLIERQKQLRDETKLVGDQVPPAAEIVDRQAQLQKEIGSLAESIREYPRAETHLQQAETAALDAAANLLDSQLEKATTDQGRVLGNLAALELALRSESKLNSPDQSAEEIAEAIQRLRDAKAVLTAAHEKQQTAKTEARQDAQLAATTLADISQMAQTALDNLDLPARVQTAFTQTAQAAMSSAKSLTETNSEKSSSVEEHSLAQVTQTVERALAVVDSALSDAERQESSVKIGELARAAEVLERAAAEERAIALESDALAEDDSLPSDEAAGQAGELATRQRDIQLIARKTVEALARIAPEAANNITDGAAKAQESGDLLQSLTDNKSTDRTQTARLAAKIARDSSQRLTDAAKNVRQSVVATAQVLATKTAAEADRIATARASVDQAIEELPERDNLSMLQTAQSELNAAMQQQAQASGKPAFGLAMQLMNQITAALEAQRAASAAAAAAGEGTSTELKATIKQEEAAESVAAAGELARKRPQSQNATSRQSSDELSQSLRDAQQAATSASRQILEGNPKDAEVSQSKATIALERARLIAQTDVTKAMEERPTHPPDVQAQAKSAATTRTAQSTASQATRRSADAVTPAVEATSAAERALSTSPSEAPGFQARAEETLQSALNQLAAEINEAASDRRTRLAELVHKNQGLADQVARVDPAAADSVDVASHATRQGSDSQNSPRQMADAETTAQMALEQAAANLGAKEQELRRDQAIAESVANLATGQQLAADTISQQSQELERLATSMDETATEEQQAAAESLNDAKHQFADSQRATGQGAVELSGQTEVANQPLREALELASLLPAKEISPENSLDAFLPQEQADSAQSDQAEEGQPGPATSTASSESGGDSQDKAKSGQSKPGKNRSAKPGELGTGFVPNSPQMTADMMAGAKAQRAAEKALGRKLPEMSPRSAGQQADSGKAKDGDQGETQPGEHAESSKLTKNDGTATTNQGVKDGPIERQPEGTSATSKSSNKARENEEKIQGQQTKEAAWFAKLPPELRKSIRAGAGQKPPRAYEERLKNYLQSVD